MSTPDCREMLDRSDKTLSIRRQCALTGVARSGVYRPKKPANDNDLALMRRLDELFTAWPFLGSRRMTEMLRAEGEKINRKRVQRLMRKPLDSLCGGIAHQHQCGHGLDRFRCRWPGHHYALAADPARASDTASVADGR